MAIDVIREEKDGIYRAVADGGVSAGYMTCRYSDAGDMVIEHTKVEADFGGQGAGQKLAERAIADARAEGRNIVPVCSYMRHYLEKNAAAVADVWRPDESAKA